MISILIPTYNYDCRPLIYEMHRQATAENVPFEIIVADDHSTDDVLANYKELPSIAHCRFVALPTNIGPANIRNFLVDKARYPYCLLMDADTFPASSDFLHQYLQAARKGSIICGGFVYERTAHPSMCALRYKYGIHVEERTASERNKRPYAQFISMCFLTDKELFKQVRFDEQMHFGYEDCNFGIRLQKQQIPLHHIDNPVYHQTTDSAADYLQKIERSIENLLPHLDSMKSYIRLLQWHSCLEKYHLTALTTTVFRMSRPLLRHNLKSNHPLLSFFAFYKLGYLCYLLKRDQHI